MERNELTAEIAGALSDPGGARVVYLHGEPGVGKSTVAAEVATRLRAKDRYVVVVNGRDISPTAVGLAHALDDGMADDVGKRRGADAAEQMSDLRDAVLVIDQFEHLVLLEPWLQRRGEAGPALLLVSRLPPHHTWRQAADGRFMSREVGELTPAEARRLLGECGLDGKMIDAVLEDGHRHPVDLRIAAQAVCRVLGAEPASSSRFADPGALPPDVRRALEALCVVRRGTEPLLAHMLASVESGSGVVSDAGCDTDPVSPRLASLPFVDCRDDGLAIPDQVRSEIVRELEALDPVRHAEFRKAAWTHIQGQLRVDPTPDTWRYTADLLYLIDNPMVRAGFFPGERSTVMVRPAAGADTEAIHGLIVEHPLASERQCLSRWLEQGLRHESVAGATLGWRVAVDHSGEVVGCSLVLAADRLPVGQRDADPVVEAFRGDLAGDPAPPRQLVLLLRTWLTKGHGEELGEVAGALWLACKQLYLDHRHSMRRLYLAAPDDKVLPALIPLGFTERGSVELGEMTRPVLATDFGPGGVHDWLVGIARRELGVEHRPHLDPGRRAVNLPGGPVALSPLEFGLITALHEAEGRPVSRASLIADVWGTSYDGGSNVVDAVVRTLRRRLGPWGRNVETVRGIGYRYVVTN